MRLLRALSAALLAGLYLWGLAPSVHVHDAGELTAASWTLGVGHPPGAPLYMILLKGFQLLVPLGSIAWRANLFSASAAVGAFLLFDSLARALTGRPGISLAGAWAFSLSVTFWSQAEMAEVYTLQVLLLLAFLRAFARASRESSGLEVPAFLWGLLLACHMGLSPLTPLVLALLATQGSRGVIGWFRSLVRLLPPLLLPLLLYAYVPLRSLRDPPLDWGDPETPLRLFWHLTNRQVRGRMLTLPIERYGERFSEYLGILAANLHILLPLALLGIAAGWRRCRTLALLLLLVLLADAGFVVFMDAAPLSSEAYAIPSVAALALLGCLGAGTLQRPGLRKGAAAFVAAGACVSLALGFPRVDLHRNFLVRDAAEGLLQQVPPGGTLFVQEDSSTNALAVLICVEGARPDLEVFDRFGNLFASLYDRPLFTVGAANLVGFRREREEPAVAERLARGCGVAFSVPLLDYSPERFALVPGTFASSTRLPGRPDPSPVGPAPLPPRPGPRPDWMSRQILAELATRRASAALSLNDRAGVRAAVEEALAWSALPEICLRGAQIARRAGEADLALRSCDGALALNPTSAPALSLKGALLLDLGRLEEAERALRAAGEGESALSQPHALLGILAARREEWPSARREFTRALELEPDQPDILHDRALAAIAEGDATSAEADLRAALRVAPHHRRACARLARLLLQSGRRGEAGEVLCGWCAAVPASALESDSLREMLLMAAQAGFPPCVRAWLERSPPAESDSMRLARAYLGAEARTLASQQR